MMGSFPKESISIPQLSFDETVSLLSGKDFWHTHYNQSLGIGALKFSDGPNGVRGEDWVNGSPSSAIPCATALGASFDVDLVRRLSQLLAAECEEKAVNALLAPTMNIHRYSLCGRNFESFSEDPLLTGILATAYVKGLQSRGVAACPKHFLANEAENGRRWSNSVIEERALREIYLEPFRMVVQNGNPWAMMTAYNAVNGYPCSESDALLSILRKEWKYPGVILSDWYGTYSSIPALKAGLDLEMPGPTKFRGTNGLRKAVETKQVSSKDLIQSAERVLNLLQKTSRLSGLSTIPPASGGKPRPLDNRETQGLLQSAVQSTMVLLKNDDNALPLTVNMTSCAVFGEHAKWPALFGGGSASLHIREEPTPLESIISRFPQTTYTAGVGIERLVKTPQNMQCVSGPISLKWYNGDAPAKENHFLSQTIHDTVYMLVEEAPEGLLDRSNFCTTMIFTFIPSDTGYFDLSICSPGSAQCSINGEIILDVKRDLSVSTEDYLFDRSKLEVRSVEPRLFQKDTKYEVVITSWSSKHEAKNVNREFFIQGCRFGMATVSDDENALRTAEEQAKQVNVAVVFVGTGPEWESEGFDRMSMDLPRKQCDLVNRVAKSCPGRTIVIVNAGSPINMSPWIENVDSVIQSWFPGSGFGEGLLGLLTGEHSPCARLPTTFWDTPEAYPAGDVGVFLAHDKNILYREGIYVGYRQPSNYPHTPRFRFGHGLSYTTFDYEIIGAGQLSISIEELKADGAEVQVGIRNTGNQTASEIALLFIQPFEQSTKRPEFEMKAFTKTPQLRPQEGIVVKLRLDLHSFAYWDVHKHSWHIEAGSYGALFAGPMGVGDWRCKNQLIMNISESYCWSD